MTRRGQIAAVFVVLVIGVALVALIVAAGPKPEPKEPEEVAERVTIQTVAPISTHVSVRATGTVVPAQELRLSPEVAGRVVELNPNLVPGGVIQSGEVIARLDTRDYQSAVSQAASRLEDARFNLELEKGRQVVALKEWATVERAGASDASKRLALRKPHLARAESAVIAAEAAVAQAKLNLTRTALVAPFNALVIAETIEVGQLVTPQVPVATLVGSNRFWVRTSVPVTELTWIARPDANGLGGAEAVVSQNLGAGRSASWRGTVVRVLGDLEPAGRLARVLIAVDEPLKNPGDGNPLLLGAYVGVTIQGREISGVYEIPRESLREGSALWIVTEDWRLVIRTEVEALRLREQTVLIREGLHEGERLVTSSIKIPVAGLKLKPAVADVEETGSSGSDDAPVGE